MLDRSDARRPAQVNACFEGGSSRRDEIVAALQQVGLTERQITVIDRPEPEDVKVETTEPTFLERIKALFGGDDEEEQQKNYDLLILAHLGDDDSLAGPVQEVFQRFGAARVNYYPATEAEMHVLGGGPSMGAETPPLSSSGTAGEAVEQTVVGASDTPGSSGATRTAEPSGTAATAGAAGAVGASVATTQTGGTTGTTDAEGRRVEPGGLDTTETTRVITSSGEGDRIEPDQEVVYRGDPSATVADTSQANRTAGDATGGTPRA